MAIFILDMINPATNTETEDDVYEKQVNVREHYDDYDNLYECQDHYHGPRTYA